MTGEAGSTELADVAVIGGGVVGASIGYGLARRGLRVAVWDEGDTALRASRGNGGLVWVQGKGLGMPDYTRLSLRSALLWPELAADLKQDTGIDVAYERRGGLQCCLSREEADERADAVAGMTADCSEDGLDIRMLEHNELKSMLPDVGPDVVAASYCPQDGAASPIRLLQALHAGIAARGSTLSYGSPAWAIEKHGDGYVIRRDEDTLTAGQVVIAAGLGSRALAGMVDIDLPIRPQKGQAIITERVGGRQEVFVIKARQTNDGHFILGASVEEDVDDLRTNFEFVGQSIARSLRILPFLRHVRLLRAWAAYRIMTPDSFPIYTESATLPGVHVAVCHSGITLSALHALEFPDVITGHAGPDRLAPFSIDRFKEAA